MGNRKSAVENMGELKAFYHNKRVLVTGNTGFKGTWICKILEYLGAEVYGFALPDSETEFYKSAVPLCHCTWGDIRDIKAVSGVIEENRPHIVIHLASHSTIDLKKELTKYIFETNTLGVVNILEALRHISGTQAVLIVTSDKCYKNMESPVPYTEENVLGAQDPYSTSKAIQELVTECYYNTFFKDTDLRIATARASNVIGGGDFNKSRLFPSIINSFLHEKTAFIRNPGAVRPWQNVLDVLYGYLLLIEKMVETNEKKEFCTPFNFGPEKDGFVTVQEVAEQLKIYFPKGCYEVTGSNMVKETNILKLDSTKAKRELGWAPKFTFKDTIGMTADFEKKYAAGISAKEICERYITHYFNSDC